jgi:1-acyl-sn-glycerol-3-phosphate acyltransferase
MRTVLYNYFRVIFWVIFRVIFRTTITGRELIPATGPVLLVVNHTSFADPPLTGIATSRRVDFLAMIELFRNPVLAWFVSGVGCIPVDRTKVDHRAAREAVRRLRAGHCVCIFPEGGIRSGERSILGGQPDLRPGAETIALLSGAAVVPVIIRNARAPYRWQNWFRRTRLSVTFGAPFCFWHARHQSRPDLLPVLRAELLKTVALG